jgi:TPR repeat protein
LLLQRRRIERRTKFWLDSKEVRPRGQHEPGTAVPYIVALILLLLVLRPAAADLGAAEAAEQRGDPAVAYQGCKADAEAGDAGCQNCLGVLSELGRGTGQDAAEARRLFRLAAPQGLAAAQYNLGRHYAAGLGLRNDEAEAARWYGMAAEQGSPAVQNALAILDATGRGVLRDPKAALELFRRAATCGYTLAQLNLAVASSPAA